MYEVIRALIILFAVCWGVLYILLSCRRGNPAWKTLLKYRYAHRGYHDKPTVPENSMAAFRRAIEHGWGAELDVHLMKDGNLAVIHDSSLKRTAGADVCIEDLTKEDLARYPLEDSRETIPLLEDVLALFEHKTPLIIELKPERGNHNELSEAVAKRLDNYKGDFCIESFDPRVLRWYRKHRYSFCRGQLAEDFFQDKDSHLSWILKYILTNLLTNVATMPDFIAYRYEHRRNFCLTKCLKWHRAVEFNWTIRTKEQMEHAEHTGAHCIFEGFDPEG